MKVNATQALRCVIDHEFVGMTPKQFAEKFEESDEYFVELQRIIWTLSNISDAALHGKPVPKDHRKAFKFLHENYLARKPLSRKARTK